MEQTGIKKRYEELKDLIRKYNEHYYEKNESLVTDYEYDMLLKEMESIEKEYPELKDTVSVTEKVGGRASGKFSKVVHKVPMLSLSNTYNIGEIEDFDKRIKKVIGEDQKIEYVLELKLDGLSISIQYENGRLEVVCENAEHNVADVLDALSAARIKPGRIWAEPPTLNDVFLEITGRELRD